MLIIKTLLYLFATTLVNTPSENVFIIKAFRKLFEINHVRGAFERISSFKYS